VNTKVFTGIGIQPMANRVINLMSEHDFGADHIGKTCEISRLGEIG